MAIKTLSDCGPEPVRFSELRRRMRGVSHKMLSQTLRSLVADGLASREVAPTVPPQVSYGLTDLGRSLEVPPAALSNWAEGNMLVIDDHPAADG